MEYRSTSEEFGAFLLLTTVSIEMGLFLDPGGGEEMGILSRPPLGGVLKTLLVNALVGVAVAAATTPFGLSCRSSSIDEVSLKFETDSNHGNQIIYSYYKVELSVRFCTGAVGRGRDVGC